MPENEQTKKIKFTAPILIHVLSGLKVKSLTECTVFHFKENAYSSLVSEILSKDTNDSKALIFGNRKASLARQSIALAGIGRSSISLGHIGFRDIGAGETSRSTEKLPDEEFKFGQ